MKISDSRIHGLAFSVLVGAIGANAQVVTTLTANPTADTFVSSTNPNSNYGHAGALAVSGVFDSVLKFDLAPMKASLDATYGVNGWNSIQSITLTVTGTPGKPVVGFATAAATTVYADWLSDDTWTEGTGRPSAPGGTGLTYNLLNNSVLPAGHSFIGSFSWNGVASGTRTIQLDTQNQAGIDADIFAGSTVSIRLYTQFGGSMVVNSEDYTAAGSHPFLSGSVVPEPAEVSTVAGGLLAVGAVIRRRYFRKA